MIRCPGGLMPTDPGTGVGPNQRSLDQPGRFRRRSLGLVRVRPPRTSRQIERLGPVPCLASLQGQGQLRRMSEERAGHYPPGPDPGQEQPQGVLPGDRPVEVEGHDGGRSIPRSLGLHGPGRVRGQPPSMLVSPPSSACPPVSPTGAPRPVLADQTSSRAGQSGPENPSRVRWAGQLH